MNSIHPFWLSSPVTPHVELEFSSKCNIRCVYCAVSKADYQGAWMDPSGVEELIRDLQRRKVCSVAINGHGETTIYPGWENLCRKLLSLGFSVHLTSNLAKSLSDSEIGTLARIQRLCVSCDTVDPVLFAKVRRGAKLEKVFSNLERVHEESVRVGNPILLAWNCGAFVENIFQLDALIQKAHEMNVKLINLFNLTEYEKRKDEFNVRNILTLPRETLEEVEGALRRAVRVAFQKGITLHIGPGLKEAIQTRLKQSGEEPVAKVVQPNRTLYASPVSKGLTRNCIDPWRYAQVNSRNNILPCCMHPAVGTIGENQESLSSILENKPIQALRAQILTGKLSDHCKGCANRSMTTPRRIKLRLIMYHFLAIIPYRPKVYFYRRVHGWFVRSAWMRRVVMRLKNGKEASQIKERTIFSIWSTSKGFARK